MRCHEFPICTSDTNTFPAGRRKFPRGISMAAKEIHLNNVHYFRIRGTCLAFAVSMSHERFFLSDLLVVASGLRFGWQKRCFEVSEKKKDIRRLRNKSGSTDSVAFH